MNDIIYYIGYDEDGNKVIIANDCSNCYGYLFEMPYDHATWAILKAKRRIFPAMYQ